MSHKLSAHVQAHRHLRTVYGVCPHDCPDCCALETQVDEHGRAVSVRGRAEHPVTRGWLCAKVNCYLDRVYHPDRLLYPMHRIGSKGSGKFERISWDEAIAEITGAGTTLLCDMVHNASCPTVMQGPLGWLTALSPIVASGTG